MIKRLTSFFVLRRFNRATQGRIRQMGNAQKEQTYYNYFS